MQKATYYDNSALFGGYSYPKTDSYSYGPAHQSYPPASLDNDYQGPVCPIQTAAVRPPTLKEGELNGDCMRQSSSQGGGGGGSSQASSIAEQQAPPLSAASPSPNGSTPQKKKSPSGGASGSGTPALTKQIFPWMKETRQNAKQKSSSSCPAPGRDDVTGKARALPLCLSVFVSLCHQFADVTAEHDD